MTAQAASSVVPLELLRVRHGLVVHQAVYAAAKLGVADLLQDGSKTASDLARQLKVNASALYRVLRALAGHGIFEVSSSGAFANNATSNYLRTGVPGSLRSMFIFAGTENFYRPFGEILHSIRTGEPARTKVLGVDGWEYLQQHPEEAQIFDDAMTDLSAMIGPRVAEAYDFGRWGSVMDVGGGNGVLLASILKACPGLCGTLADQPDVLERARQKGFLGGELQGRSAMQPCDFFREVPTGCRAYVMKNVIHDWDDEHAVHILANCRRAVPADGALVLVEWGLPEGPGPAVGKLYDVVMLVMTGGRERAIEEYRQLLARGGFQLNQVIPASPELNVIEALPA